MFQKLLPMTLSISWLSFPIKGFMIDKIHSKISKSEHDFSMK